MIVPMSKLRHAAVLLLLTCAAAPAATDPEGRKAVARAYLKTLETMDWRAQATFLTEESVFEDPTAIYFGEPWRYVGAEAIAGFWQSATEGGGTIEIHHDIRRLFVTGPYVVIDLAATVRNRGDLIGFPDREYQGTIQTSTILRIEDGKVLHHLDHADYEGAWAVLDALKQRFEAEALAGEKAGDPR